MVDAVPAVLTVGIDIDPDDFPNRIKLSDRDVEVAILSATTFNAVKEVNCSSVTFGRTGNAASLISCKEVDDVNGDRLLDLICEFRV